MRLRISLLAWIMSAPALAQQAPAAGEPVSSRIAAATEALSQYRPLDNGVWSGVSLGQIEDRRPDLSRRVTTRAVQLGYDHRFASPFTANDQLLLGLAVAALDSSSRIDAQNMRIDSRGWSVSGYGVYAPYVFLSFPVALTYGRWNSDQSRDGTPLLPVYSTSYQSTSFASSIGAALTVPVSRLLWTTSLTHRYSDNNRPAYSEAINPLATDFQTTAAEVTDSSQLIASMRLALPFEGGRLWGSAGYAYDLRRSPIEATRSEFPLGLGVELMSARWQLGAAGQVILRDDITCYSGGMTARLQF